MITEAGVIVQLFAIVFLHVFPQCRVGIAMGHEHIWTGNGSEVDAEILYRTIDRVGMKPNWTEADERPERDLALEHRIMSFRSRRYPQIIITYAQCLRRHR